LDVDSTPGEGTTVSVTIPAIRTEATGYLLKETPRKELFGAIRATALGKLGVDNPTAAVTTAVERRIIRL